MHILYALAEWRLDECNAVREAIKQTVGGCPLLLLGLFWAGSFRERPAGAQEDTAIGLRHLPIGEDAKGCRYFFFSDQNEDCRLYREEPPGRRQGKKHKGEEALWGTACITLEDLSDFSARLGASRNKSDRALHEVLEADILPQLRDTVQARRKAEERAAALEAMPKKRSSRLQVGTRPSHCRWGIPLKWLLCKELGQPL